MQNVAAAKRLMFHLKSCTAVTPLIKLKKGTDAEEKEKHRNVIARKITELKAANMELEQSQQVS